MTSTVELSALSIAQLAEKIVERQQQIKARNDYVLTRDDAKIYVGRDSDDSFDAWRKKHKVRACSHGRYAKRHLDVALQFEARVRA
jgi:hypothetical protein